MSREQGPIFIIGAPRSGTTWLLSLLEQHPDCRAVTPGDLGIKPAGPTKETGIFMRGLDEREIIARFARLPAESVPVEKTPGHLLQVGRIKRLFPQARIVLVRRDPTDVIWSMTRENPFWKESPENLAEAVALYNDYAIAQDLYRGFDAIVEYDRLWESPEQELSRLLGELELDPGPAADMVAAVHAGRSLPPGLEGVFRKGLPGEGGRHFSEQDREYLAQHLYTAGHVRPGPNVLLAANHLLGWTGSETLLLTLVAGLVELGCRVSVYVRHWSSAWVGAHFDPRIRITDNLETIRQLSFDIAHVHHSSALIDVRAAFPELPVIFSSLGILPFLEQPPPFEVGVWHYLAISEEVRDNLASQGVDPGSITIVRNLVDDAHFTPGGRIRPRPERILVLSYKLDAGRKERLVQAAARLGASIRFLGLPGSEMPQDGLCEAINASDVVVSLGRGVIETMLCGRVPLVFDRYGGDGLVTPERFGDFLTCNFSGRFASRDFTVDELIAELGQYQQRYGRELMAMARASFGTRENLPGLVRLYRDVISGAPSPGLPAERLSLLEYVHRMAREDRMFTSRCQQALEAAEAEVRRLKRSVSWRVTSPLRTGWNSLRSLRGLLARRDG